MHGDHQHFEEKSWSEFGKNLLWEKGSDRQKAFLTACLGRDTFIEELNQNLHLEQGSSNIPFDYTFTEAEFRQPCPEAEQAIWKAFQGIDEETASDDRFWGAVVFKMIKARQIKPAWLAADSGEEEDEGGQRIARVLDSGKEIDDCTRRVLRSLCHRGPRRKRVIFYDFSLGKVWWRRHWAQKMVELLRKDEEKLLGILNATSYKTIAEKLYSGRSYLGMENVFAGLLLFMCEHPHPVKGGQLKAIIDSLAYLASWKAIELQPPEENCKEIRRIWRDINA